MTEIQQDKCNEPSMFDAHCKSEFENIKTSLNTITVALLGDMKEQGLISRLRDVEKAVNICPQNGNAYPFVKRLFSNPQQFLTLSVLVFIFLNMIVSIFVTKKPLTPDEIKELIVKTVNMTANP